MLIMYLNHNASQRVKNLQNKINQEAGITIFSQKFHSHCMKLCFDQEKKTLNNTNKKEEANTKNGLCR